METEDRVRIQELRRDEIDALLARNRIGRIAYSFRDRVDIEPIHFVYDDEGWIYGRTSRGAKLTTIGHNYWVAFEVDEIHSFYDWRSVVVHGGFYTISAGADAPDRREAWHRGVELIRSIVPEAFTGDDPTPSRDVMFRIAVQEASGRAASAV